MINNLIFSLFPILLSLIAGWGAGRVANKKTRDILVGYITFLVWLLLISIGFQFGSILFDKQLGRTIIFESFLYSTIITFITFILLFKKVKNTSTHKKSIYEILKPILECVVAILMVLIGMILYLILPSDWNGEAVSSLLLYILIFLVGVDLSIIKIQSLTINHFKVPLVTICALFIAAYLTTFVLDKSFPELIVLGSGFGWFSLSGPLIGKTLGAEQGTFALLTDLIREFYAIGLLYLLGKNYPNPVIGVCGATAMDSTLPFIKNNCSQLDVQIAIFSGFILTILAPFFIIFFSIFI
ncbi:lysine exporter LysO family protein [Acinetobacter sp. NIPH 2699]|uniref:lysine exporter LysO family protein n=1 Tax=Acinetobacter sp. NIPH 2699 TaxID=2923433 RepID=UPI001F4B2180|nr:lysine exporter LysO family protein [Acinetobacter sp. NIPH 2699]MCH7335198.1 lysine exporter LysO family protein [Acinetobacter sp. NIPH 2699]